MQPHFWVCAECGWKPEGPIDACPKCGNRIWGKVLRVEENESENGGKLFEHLSTQRSAESIILYLKLIFDLFNSVECGVCSSIIYKPDGKFDQDVLRANKMRHYLESPGCIPSLHNAT